MPFRWNKRVQLEPWRELRLEVRSMSQPRPAGKKPQGKERLRGTLREEIRVEGGRPVSRNFISFEACDLPEILHAFQGAVDALPSDSFDFEIPPTPDRSTWARLNSHLLRRQEREGRANTSPPMMAPFPSEYWPDYVNWAKDIGLLRVLEAFLSRSEERRRRE